MFLNNSIIVSFVGWHLLTKNSDFTAKIKTHFYNTSEFLLDVHTCMHPSKFKFLLGVFMNPDYISVINQIFIIFEEQIDIHSI